MKSRDHSLRIASSDSVWGRSSTWWDEDHPLGTTQENKSLEGREEGLREAKIACQNLWGLYQELASCES